LLLTEIIDRASDARRVRGLHMALTLALTLVAALLVTTVSAPAAQAASLQEVSNFGSNPGNLRMFKYIPDGLPANAPLVVGLHGCSQSASSYDDESGWVKMADTYGFALVFPQQQVINNSLSCFNWFEPGDTARDSGEALSIKQMIDKVESTHSTDSARVFVTGLSGGGAMTSVMLAAYPDVFAGGGVVAGVPAYCATNSTEAFACMDPGVDKTPQQWGDLARSGYPAWTGPWPKVSVWHGSEDTTVREMNLRESMEQWTNVHGTDQTVDQQETIKGYPRKVYKDAAGVPVVETWLLQGQPHGQPLDPGTAADQCGVAGAIGMVDMNICAAYHMVPFFGLDGSGSEPSPEPSPEPEPTEPTIVSLGSRSEDGYVKAYSNGTGVEVGTAKLTLGLGIGRGTDAKINRTVLSFDTSAIPDDAVITRAYVTVKLNSAYGDPWANPAGNVLAVDVKTGCLGSSCSVQTDDWSASATVSGAARIDKWTSGTKASTDFSQAGLDAVAKTDITQLKLGFTQFQSSTAYVIIAHGADAQLTVEYSAP
jgi:poly(hydroxyalkanoate) depolymerase family esterase